MLYILDVRQSPLPLPSSYMYARDAGIWRLHAPSAPVILIAALSRNPRSTGTVLRIRYTAEICEAVSYYKYVEQSVYYGTVAATGWKQVIYNKYGLELGLNVVIGLERGEEYVWEPDNEQNDSADDLDQDRSAELGAT